MSRITKEIALSTALSLLKPKSEKIKQMKLDLKKIVTKSVKDTIPEDVLAMYNKFPDYFNIHSSSRLSCAGFGYEYYSFEVLPYNNKYPKITEVNGKKILELSHRIEIAEKEYRRLKDEITNALFAFRTYSNVEKEFPEAFALLPTRVSQAVMINIESIRKSIA